MLSSKLTLPEAVVTRASALCHELQAELCDDAETDTRDLAQCGLATLPALRACLAFIDSIRLKEGSASVRNDIDLGVRYQQLCMDVDALFELADEGINTVPFHQVDRKWLRLYTDTSLLRSLLDLFAGPPSPDDDDDDDAGDKEEEEEEEHDPRSFWMAAVRRLDMAIIVAGAVGPNRRIWVLELISLLQEVGLPRLRLPAPMSNASTVELSTLESDDSLEFATRRIPTLDPPPDLEQYLQQYTLEPFIVRRYAGTDDKAFQVWPALARWGSAEYILDVVGEGRWVPVEVGEAYDQEGWGQRIIPLRTFLARAGFECEPEQGFSLDDSDESELDGDEDEDERVARPLYLAQHSLFLQFPQLERDFAIPDYVWSGPPTPVDVPGYKPPEVDEGVIVNVWIGSGKGEIVSPPHTDPYYNCYTQVLGRKRVWLAPPSAGPYMQAHGQSHPDEQGGSSSTLASMYMSNTSTVPILRRGYSAERIRVDYPQFAEKGFPTSMEAVLEPGDLLVMPPGWWHAMRGEGDGPGWSISMWY